MDLILSKRTQKDQKLKKQAYDQDSHTKPLKLLPDDLYKKLTRKKKNRDTDLKSKKPIRQFSKHKLSLSSSSSTSSLASIGSLSVTSSTENMSDLSFESDDEIPVWVRGEQRWISGITNETTCAQLVDALLRNENITGAPAALLAAHQNGQQSASAATEHQYAITERWRRVEQMLDNKTKILKIWKAWGETKSEVRLTLRRIDTLAHHSRHRSRSHHVDYDSANESAVSRADSAILRRKRHRSAKSSYAWSKNVDTIHPKSSKATIEKLMKLILEQGETIQQQLTKLKNRERQISKIESGHRTHREHDMGKNYLLETYLNRLNDIDGDDDDDDDDVDEEDIDGNVNNQNDDQTEEIDKELRTPPNSDSGVNTEDVATSPEIGLSSPSPNAAPSTSSQTTDNNNNNNNKTDKISSTGSEVHESSNEICKRQSIKQKTSKKQSPRKLHHTTAQSREAKLMKEHESRKEFCRKLETDTNSNSLGVSDSTAAAAATTTATATSSDKRDLNDHLAGQIELLEKVIAINKHIQHEEELMVRLSAKIQKYEVDNPNLSEGEMKVVLERINSNIESSSSELKKTENELNESNQMLLDKSKMVEQLSMELEALELSEPHENQNIIHVPSHQIQIHSENREAFESAAQCRQMEQANNEQQPFTCQAFVPNAAKTGTLPKLISSALTKSAPVNACNTYSGTIPKIQQQQPPQQRYNHRDIVVPMSTAAHRPAIVSIPSSAVYVAKNQSFLIPDHVVLSQAPLFFQKSDFNGNFTQSTDQRNINTNYNHPSNSNNHTNLNVNSNSMHINSVNFNPSMANAKVGPKKMINGFYKDPDSDTGLSSMGDDGFQQLGTLV